jgi:putative hydrolase of the HAD superfamily
MDGYKFLFFDLDHTLWDFEKNSSDTLSELFALHRLEQFGLFNLETFLSTYNEVNRSLWDLYNHGKITTETLREKRFTDSFLRLGLKKELHPEKIADQYLEICPGKTALFPNATRVLDYLSGKYRLGIITNGFPDTQERKLKNCGLFPYFDQVIISGQVGFSKPSKGIFDFAVNAAEASYSESLMIGDNLEADVRGATNAGMDAVWFNEQKKQEKHKARYEINDLKDLLSFL